MKNILITFLTLIIFSTPANTQKKVPSKSKQINTFISTIHRDGQFSGAILVADHGQVIYKKGFGYADRRNKELSEAYMIAGNKESAIANYKKTLELNPFNTSAKQMIEKLIKQ